MAERRVDIRVNLDDAEAIRRLDELSARLDRLKASFDELSNRSVTPRIDLRGGDEALLTLDRVSARLDEIGQRDVTARVNIRTDTNALSRDARRLVDNGGGDIARNLERDAARAAGAGGGGLGSGLLSSLGGANNQYTGGLIGALIAYAASIAPALIPFGLGGLVGGGAAGGAFMIGSKAQQQILQLQQSLGSAKGPQRQQILAQIAAIRQSKGPELQTFGAVQGLGRDALGIFNNALTSLSKGFSGGPGGHPGSSFLGGLDAILKQIGGFIKSIGPGLGQMFRASLPSLQGFIKIMEQLAKAVLPSITQSLRSLNKSGALPILVQGFKYLSQGIAGFIKNLGPGIKDAAIIFKGSMKIAELALRATGSAATGFAQLIIYVTHTIEKLAKGATTGFEQMWHLIVSLFHQGESAVSSAWSSIWHSSVSFVERIYHDVLAWWDRLPSGIREALASIPGELFGIGAQMLSALLHGIESQAGGVLAAIRNIGSEIVSALSQIPGVGTAISIGSKVASLIPHARGGIIDEPIVGYGMRTGAIHTFGEGGIREMVTPLGSSGGGGGGNVHITIQGALDVDNTARQMLKVLKRYQERHGRVALNLA